MLTREQAGVLLSKGLSKFFYEGYFDAPEVFPKIFTVTTSNQSAERFAEAAGLSPWEKYEGTVEYEDITFGPEWSISHETYHKGFLVPWELVEDDQYNVLSPYGQVGRDTRDLGRRARERAEMVAAAVFNNAFSTNGYDGVPLCSSSHPLAKPNILTGATTCGNKLTDALSESALESAVLMLESQVTPAGIPIDFSSQEYTLLIHPSQQFAAAKILGTATTPFSDTGELTINAVRARFTTPIVWAYLTSQNNWFVLSRMSKEHLLFFWRIKPTLYRTPDVDHFTFRFAGRMRCSAGYVNFRGLVGSQVSG